MKVIFLLYLNLASDNDATVAEFVRKVEGIEAIGLCSSEALSGWEYECNGSNFQAHKFNKSARSRD